MADHLENSSLIPPSPITDPTEIDLEAGPGEQIQCRICLETDGKVFIFYSLYLFFYVYLFHILFSKLGT